MSTEFNEKQGSDLIRLMAGCLLFRLGGEQSFSAEEIDDIKKTVGGIQVLLTPDNRILVRSRSPESYSDLIDRGAEQL